MDIMRTLQSVAVDTAELLGLQAARFLDHSEPKCRQDPIRLLSNEDCPRTHERHDRKELVYSHSLEANRLKLAMLFDWEGCHYSLSPLNHHNTSQSCAFDNSCMLHTC